MPLLAAVVRFISRLMWLAPLKLSRAVGICIGILWFDVLRIRRKVVLSNLQIAFPEWSEKQRVQVARESMFGMGQTLAEFLLMVDFSKQDALKVFEFEGLNHLDQAFAKEKGVLLLTCHLGNGDYGCAAMARKGYRLNMISKQFKAVWLNDAWFGLRRRMGTGFIREEKSSAEILKALKRNEGVIFVLDQFMGPPVGVRTQFFGKVTGTAMGLAVFAQRTKAPLVPAYTFRLPDGRLKIVFDAELDLGPLLDDRANIPRMTQIYTDKIEQYVRAHPEQWMWLHRRWKEFRD